MSSGLMGHLRLESKLFLFFTKPLRKMKKVTISTISKKRVQLVRGFPGWESIEVQVSKRFVNDFFQALSLSGFNCKCNVQMSLSYSFS